MRRKEMEELPHGGQWPVRASWLATSMSTLELFGQEGIIAVMIANIKADRAV